MRHFNKKLLQSGAVPPKQPQTSLHYGTEGFKRASQFFITMPFGDLFSKTDTPLTSFHIKNMSSSHFSLLPFIAIALL